MTSNGKLINVCFNSSGQRLMVKTTQKSDLPCSAIFSVIVNFLRNLDNCSRVLLLSGGLKLAFLEHTCDTVRRFISVSVHKLYKIEDRLVTRGTVRPGGSSVCFSALARWSMDDNMSINHILT